MAILAQTILPGDTPYRRVKKPGSTTRRGIPENIGVPTRPQPIRCTACGTPIWRWNGVAWVCYNCKYYAIIYDRQDGDLSTLDGCRDTGIYPDDHQQLAGSSPAGQQHLPAVTRPAAATPAGDSLFIGALTDTCLSILVNGQVVHKPITRPLSHIGDVMQLCLDHNVAALWIVAGTALSAAATPGFIDAAKESGVWGIKGPSYSYMKRVKDASTGKKRKTTTEKSRCMFVAGWKNKEARAAGESDRLLFIGYAEHNIDWQLDSIKEPGTLLFVLSYLEGALGVPVRYSAGYTGGSLMQDTNKRKRADWIHPVDIASIEPTMNNPLMNTGCSDIGWKRALTEEELATCGYLVAYDKNSMYTASCTSVLLGSGMPQLVKHPTFDCKNILPGLWHCSITGTSEFDGMNLPHPTDGIMQGWFWTYTVKLLLELGYSVEIDQAYVWTKNQAHTILRPFAEKSWKARASLNDKYEPDTSHYPDQAARAIAAESIKLVQVKAIGWLDMTSKVLEDGKAYDGYRPDHNALIKDNARYQMFWRIRSIYQKTGKKPCGVHVDCFFYPADTDDHQVAVPHMLDRYNPRTKLYEPASTKLGGYKRKYKHLTITMDQAAPLFNDPAMHITTINNYLIDQEAEKEEEVTING